MAASSASPGGLLGDIAARVGVRMFGSPCNPKPSTLNPAMYGCMISGSWGYGSFTKKGFRV